MIEGRSVLVVSATQRREGMSDEDDGIWQVDWETKAERKLELHGRDACSFAPHGIATVEVEPGRWQLWAINHHRATDAERSGCEARGHSVERYRIEADGLHFVERLSGPELTNPNDLDVVADGRLWISNNPPWQEEGGLVGDLLLRRAKGQILHYDPALGRFSVVADELVFPNGVAVVGDALWVSAANGKLFRFALAGDGGGVLSAERQLYRTSPKATLDNIMEAEGSLWLTGHPKGLKFIRHSKRPSSIAPTIAYRVDPSSGVVETVAHWRRGEANAGATVLPIDDALVVGLVFDDGLRVCSTKGER